MAQCPTTPHPLSSQDESRFAQADVVLLHYSVTNVTLLYDFSVLCRSSLSILSVACICALRFQLVACIYTAILCYYR